MAETRQQDGRKPLTWPYLFSRFELKIELGNEAMQHGMDVASALTKVALKVGADGATEGDIRDDNGNKVGTFRFWGKR